MTYIHYLAATLLLMTALSCAFLPFISVWDRHLAVARRRSLYDKSARQTESLTAGLHLLFAVALAADLLMKGTIDAMLSGPWRFLWEILVLSAAFAALCTVIVRFAQKGIRSFFGILAGLGGTLSACIVCLLVWAFYLGALKEAAAGGEQATQAFMVVMAGTQSVGFILFAVFSFCIALSCAYGFALCWHILMRGKDDFGRDYYTFALGIRSRQAAYAGMLVLPVSAVQFWMYPTVALEWAQTLLPGTREYAELILTGGMLCFPVAVLFWYVMSRSALPMQRRSLAFLAIIMLVAGVYCALGRI